MGDFWNQVDAGLSDGEARLNSFAFWNSVEKLTPPGTALSPQTIEAIERDVLAVSDDDPTVTAAQAEEILGVSERKIRRLTQLHTNQRGELLVPVGRTGGQHTARRYRLSDVRRCLGSD